MRVDAIEIHPGAVDFQYEPIRQLEAKCEAPTSFSKAPTIADANLKLQELAAKVGANAVVNVTYNSGMSLTSWRAVKATGLAVRKLSDEMACPVCAETIKRAAKKCRFCGADLAGAPAAVSPAAPHSVDVPAAQPWSAPSVPHQVLNREPLRADDNAAGKWIAIAAVVLAIFAVIAAVAAS